MPVKEAVKLIGIRLQIQRSLNLSEPESPRLQKSRLPGALPVRARRGCTKPLAPRGSRQRHPVALDLRQRRVDERLADAPLEKLGAYFRGSLGSAHAAADELLRETCFVQEPFLLQPVEHLISHVPGMGTGKKFPAQFKSAVLPAGKQVQRLLAAGTPLFLQWVVGRFRLA